MLGLKRTVLVPTAFGLALLAAGGSAATTNAATVYPPALGPIVQYSDVGGSTLTVRHGDVGSRRLTAPVVFTTPAGTGTFDALVSVTARYHAVGTGKFYFTLAARSSGHPQAHVIPSTRLVATGKADSSTTVQFWVKGLVGSRQYKFYPDVAAPLGGTSYISMYQVTTRIDLVATD